MIHFTNSGLISCHTEVLYIAHMNGTSDHSTLQSHCHMTRPIISYRSPIVLSNCHMAWTPSTLQIWSCSISFVFCVAYTYHVWLYVIWYYQ